MELSRRLSATVRPPLSVKPDVAPVVAGHPLPQVESVSTSASWASARVAGIDLLRVFAVVGVVWFHTEGAPYHLIGYAGLPAFLLIYFSLLTRQGATRSAAQFVQRRWCRLLKPWLFWSAVYAVGKLAKAAYMMDWGALARLLSPQTLLVGTSIHLWYLPYAFLSGLLLYAVNRRLSKADDTRVVCVATLVGILVLVASTVSLHVYALVPPLRQWEFGLAAIPLGLAVGRSLAAPSRRQRIVRLSLISATTVAASAILVSRGLPSTVVPYSLALVLVCLAYECQISNNAFVATVAPLTLGIYLIHPLTMYGLTRFLPPEGHHVAFILLTTCISGVVTWVLMQTPLRRFV